MYLINSSKYGHSHARLVARNGASLRILCLGASITFGQGSTTGNGYRKDLRDLLVADGNTVHFVGTQSSGNMLNNANEGYPGRRIDQVSGLGWNAYGYLPNVVVIHCGTNDFAQGYDPTTSANRLGTMVDQIYSALPSTVLVVVSKLLPNRKPSTEQGIESFNSLLDGIVANRTSQGKNVALVDMHSSQFSLADIGPDGTHPTDAGYQKVAGVWHDAIAAAINLNKIASLKPNGLSDTDNSNDNKCAFTPSAIPPAGWEQFGFGTKASIFQGAWVDAGVILTDPLEPKMETGVYWADVDGKNGDDYVHITSDGSMHVALSSCGEKTGGITSYGTPPKCDRSKVRFADVNGDGIAEYICTSLDGS